MKHHYSGPDALLADIGATNARFALLSEDRVMETDITPCADYPTLESAIERYLSRFPEGRRPRVGALAIASPIFGDRITMTNHGWHFSINGVREQFGFDNLHFINDFTAAALSLPLLTAEDCTQVGDGQPIAGEPIGILGPGTGLGGSGLVWSGRSWIALSAEGGHVTMPAISDRESAVLAQLRKRFDHVSAERILSGSGLVNLYHAIAAADHREEPDLTPPEITERALSGLDPICEETLEMFCAMLGTIAGNLALAMGTRGGVYIAGGIVPRWGSFFHRSRFRKRFVEKGRLRDYLSGIPTYVITHPLPAFLGLKHRLIQISEGLAPGQS